MTAKDTDDIYFLDTYNKRKGKNIGIHLLEMVAMVVPSMVVGALHNGHRARSIVHHIVAHTPKDSPTQNNKSQKNSFLRTRKKNKDSVIDL